MCSILIPLFLLQNGRDLNSYFVGVVGNGSTINFWGDNWIGNGPLRKQYPKLFSLEKHKWATVASRVQFVDGVKTLSWEWRRNPATNEEVNEIFALLSAIYDHPWEIGEDCWKWEGDKDGAYTVNKAKKLLVESQMQANDSKLKWDGWTPLKCRIMVWRAELNRLPTKMELGKRGIQIANEACPLCDTDLETATHLFTGCWFTSEIWSRVGAWCRLSPIFAFDISDLLMLADTQTKSKKEAQILRGIIYTAMWSIWNERNSRVFNNKSRRAIEVTENIKLSSFFWIRHRSRIKNIDWNRWCEYPLGLM